MNLAGNFKKRGAAWPRPSFLRVPSMSDSLEVQVLFTSEREVKCSEDGEAETKTRRAAKPLANPHVAVLWEGRAGDCSP
jgi:hypothetical protein